MAGSVTTHVTEIVLPGPVDTDGLEVRIRELPAPGEGQVVLRMEATGVSFAEQQMRLGKYYDQPSFPFVPGYDVVGTVAATGAGVDPALEGRRFAAVIKIGGWASHLHVAAADLVPVPDGVDAAAAETVVLNGVTAWQMLHRSASVRKGGMIVVLGANGGVGSTLVQLARHAGIRVIGTAAQRHHDTVRQLGATPVDYHDPDMYHQIRALAPDGVDAVFDHVGGMGLAQSLAAAPQRRNSGQLRHGVGEGRGGQRDPAVPETHCPSVRLEPPAQRQKRDVLQLLGRQAPPRHLPGPAERGPHPGATPGRRWRADTADRRTDPTQSRR